MEVIMKTKKVMFLTAAIVLFGMAACDSNNSYDPDRGPAVQIIKLKKPEYKDYIMTYSPSQQGETVTLATEKFALPDSVFWAIEGQPLVGRYPYIELTDGYLMVDWKWGRICYAGADAIVNEPWSTLKSIDEEWAFEQILADKPITECYYIHPDDISEYEPSLKHKGWLPITPGGNWTSELESLEDWKKLPEAGQKALTEQVEYMNAAYAEYENVLNRMISEEKLKHYAFELKLHEK